MAAVTSAVIGAIAAAGSLVHSVAQAQDQKNIANQAKNGAQQDADKAKAAQDMADSNMQLQKAANAARAAQRNRSAGSAAVPTAQPTLLNPQPAPQPGAGTLLGQ